MKRDTLRMWRRRRATLCCWQGHQKQPTDRPINKCTKGKKRQEKETKIMYKCTRRKAIDATVVKAAKNQQNQSIK